MAMNLMVQQQPLLTSRGTQSSHNGDVVRGGELVTRHGDVVSGLVAMGPGKMPNHQWNAILQAGMVQEMERANFDLKMLGLNSVKEKPHAILQEQHAILDQNSKKNHKRDG